MSPRRATGRKPHIFFADGRWRASYLARNLAAMKNVTLAKIFIAHLNTRKPQP